MITPFLTGIADSWYIEARRPDNEEKSQAKRDPFTGQASFSTKMNPIPNYETMLAVALAEARLGVGGFATTLIVWFRRAKRSRPENRSITIRFGSRRVSAQISPAPCRT